jgi:hypothetical protein
MELEGSLKAFSLPEILQFLAMGKLTGTLMVRSDHQGIDLVIRQGRIVNSATLNHSRRLGQLLVSRRLVRRTDLENVLHDQKTIQPDQRLGQLLLERELIAIEDLRATIKAQLEEEIWELFSWEDGEFRFENCTEADIHNVLVEIDVEPLIIEGTRRIDEWKAIIRSLRGDSTVLGLHPWNPADRSDITLTPPEWQVLSLVNGFFSIGSIAARAGVGRFEAYRILSTFLAANIVFIKEETEAAPAMPDDLDQEDDTRKTIVDETAGKGGWSLFRKRGADLTAESDKAEVFVSPIGLLARFINRLVMACISHRDCNVAAGDERFLEREWTRIVNDCPAADLLRVQGNQVDATLLERYFAFDREGEVTGRPYEDAIAGLRRLYASLTVLFSQRMGERSFQRVVQAVQSEWVPRTTVQRPRNFRFEDFLGRSLPS